MPNLVELLTSVTNRSLLGKASLVLLGCIAAMLSVPYAQAQTFVVLHTLPVSFYLCFEHVDNLGAYTASRPETGLLIPSVFDN